MSDTVRIQGNFLIEDGRLVEADIYISSEKAKELGITTTHTHFSILREVDETPSRPQDIARTVREPQGAEETATEPHNRQET